MQHAAGVLYPSASCALVSCMSMLVMSPDWAACRRPVSAHASACAAAAAAAASLLWPCQHVMLCLLHWPALVFVTRLVCINHTVRGCVDWFLSVQDCRAPGPVLAAGLPFKDAGCFLVSMEYRPLSPDS
jgi:hypothetical protein